MNTIRQQTERQRAFDAAWRWTKPRVLAGKTVAFEEIAARVRAKCPGADDDFIIRSIGDACAHWRHSLRASRRRRAAKLRREIRRLVESAVIDFAKPEFCRTREAETARLYDTLIECLTLVRLATSDTVIRVPRQQFRGRTPQ